MKSSPTVNSVGVQRVQLLVPSLLKNLSFSLLLVAHTESSFLNTWSA